jgi:hypothetical protein
LIRQGETAHLQFDFGSTALFLGGPFGPGLTPQPSTPVLPPFHNVNFQLHFNPGGELDLGELLTATTSDANGDLVSGTVSIPGIWIDAAMGLETGFGGPAGLFRSLGTLTGYLALTAVQGDVALNFFWASAAPSESALIATGWVQGAGVGVRAAVPEPSTTALALSAAAASVLSLIVRRRPNAVSA